MLLTYAAATVISLLIELTGIVGKSIILYNRIFYRTLHRQNQHLIEELERRDAFGAAVGFVERQIYLYALVSNQVSLISPILLFKGFNGWIINVNSENSTSKIGAVTPNRGVDLDSQIRFYLYAIGNFISLAWAVIVWEFVRFMKDNSAFGKYLVS